MRGLRSYWLRLFGVCTLLLAQLSAPASAIVIDLSERQIDILYSFDGADLILFGTVGDTELDPELAGFDVVIVVRGPELPATVRQKDNVGGIIWVNDESVRFPAAPGYYAVAANRALADIASSVTYAQAGIGFENLRLAVDESVGVRARKDTFQAALYRIREGAGLYRQERDSVTLIGEGLFRTDVRLPSNVPVGEFFVDAFLFQDGVLKARDRISLTVDKAGFERTVFTFAHQYSFFYGLIAVMIALVAGWLAGVLGKK